MKKIISIYKDKMQLERLKILNEYNDDIYFLYSITDKYNLYNCKTKEYINLSIEQLPDGIPVGSMLNLESGVYIINKIATNEINKKIEKMNERILEEQKQYFESKRIEEHVYEVGEIESDRIWLYDITEENGDGIEEIDFPEELLKKLKEGDKVIYKNGEYVACNGVVNGDVVV